MTVTGPQRPRSTGRPTASGRVGPRRDLSLDVLPLTHAAGAVAAFQAAAGSLVIVLVPVVLTWVVTGGGSASWLEVVQLATMLWLLAQHTGLAVEGGQLSLVPLGLGLLPLLACAYAGTRLARSLDPMAERIAAGASRARPQPAPRAALVAMSVAHGLVGLLIASTLAMTELTPLLWQSFAGPAVVALLGGGLGSLAYAHGGARAGIAALRAAVPPRLRRLVDPVGRALAVQGAAAALAVLAGIVVGFGRIVDLYDALGGGPFGIVMITLLQVVLVPNVVIWAAALLAGPGFAVGAGTEVSPLATTLGPLPALPILGALPDPGAKPGYWLLVLVVPLAAGAAAAHRLLGAADHDEGRGGLRGAAEDVAGLGLLAGAGAGVLAWLSGGPSGPGRLAEVGPNPVLVAGVFAVEVALGAALLFLVRRAAPGTADRLAAWRGRYRRGS